jgi:hypothetical protein
MNEEQIKALWLRVTGFDADGDAADIIGFARALLADGGKGEAVTLTGAQLLEALDFVAPDRPHDADQLECEVTIQRGEGHDGPGTYCWLTEYPEEGATLLDGKAATQAECAPREAHPVAHFIYDKEDDLWEQVRGEFASDADVVPLFRRSSPESAKQGDFAAFCEHYIDASEDVNREWLFNIVSKWIQWNAAPTPERADAEKDAVRYRWMRDQNKRMHYTTDYQPDGCTDLIQIEVPVVGEPIFTPEGHFDFSMELDRAIDAAILAANKEKK